MKNSTFSELVDRLTQSTGLNFIYSSNNVDTQTPVSISARGNTVEELFSEISALLGITFQLNERHVVIKGQLVTRESAFLATKEKTDNSLEEEEYKNSIQRTKAEVLAKESPRLPLEYYLRYPKFDEPLQSGFFGHSRIYKGRPMWMRKLNLGLGMLTSDIGTGLELTPGYGSAYFVLQPIWQHNNGFTMGYGAGVALPEFLGFRININYIYAGINFQEPISAEEYTPDPSSVLPKPSRMEFVNQRLNQMGSFDVGRYSPRSSVNIHQHQVNILFNYHLTEKVRLQLGPTFNFASTTTWVDNWHKVFSHAGEYIQSDRRGGYPAPAPALPNFEQQGIRDFASSFEPEKISNFWVGWRAGIIYKFQLFDN
ncbi:STN domain-containing protein [Pleomorphovibrio marinus]|uniref:STN domain-containing protein n=1 Tax=Pleomorphovibrio marinus TaxID=2164132 RepID=UPI0018E52542|nr:STN domain-containing protein [Pleomorphovibrio marinus]